MATENKVRVLVGTYRPVCLDWIRSKFLYNLPMWDGADLSAYDRINRIVLFAEGCAPIAYAVKSHTLADKRFLRRSGYPLTNNPHGKYYALFELGDELDAREVLSQEGIEVCVFTSRWTGVIDKSFFSRPFPSCVGRSTAHIFQELGPYYKRWSTAVGITAKQLDFMKSLGIDITKEIPYAGPGKKNAKFSFIDLFAGIGGFRLAMQACGGRCVFTSEFDPPAQATYEANYGDKPYGDITKQETKGAIPTKFDIVCAGFPCQAFSLAGKRMGFNDNFKGLCRGTLFKEVVEICEQHRPKAVFCENVKGLLIHDKGRTLQVIKGAFEEIGYQFDYYVLNSKDFGVPQNRERVYMVAFRKDIVKKLKKGEAEWHFPFAEIEKANKGKHKVCLEDVLEKKVSARYYLSDVYMETLRRHRARHEAAGHGFGFEIRDRKGISGAIVCGGMGRERNLVQEPGKKTPAGLVPETHIKGHINQEGIRKMTPREWARLQGFPEDFKFVVSDVHLYKQFGNSVSVPVIKAISSTIVECLKNANA